MFLSQQTLQDIIEQDNFILRNLQITQGYYHLSEGMKRMVGDRNVNWCTFATHASKTAGHSIRHEVLPKSVLEMLDKLVGYRELVFLLHDYLKYPAERIHRSSFNFLEDILVHISMNIVEGNYKVFAELSFPFADMVNTFQDDPCPDTRKLELFLARHFKPGKVEHGGQDFLIEAFAAYYQARFETNQKRKAELIFLANLLVGTHEQIRLQPHIANALCAPVARIAEGRIVELMNYLPAPLTDKLQRRVTLAGKNLFAHVATYTMMVVTLPSGDLQLGHDVRPSIPHLKFPFELRALDNSRLRQLIGQWDQGLDTLTGSGAQNWANLTDRMGFIVDLFRSHQQNQNLFRSPFTLMQSRGIEMGAIPAGKL